MTASPPPPGHGLGAGTFSPAAEARLAAGRLDEDPVGLPDLTDLAAVARWREATHAAWGEGTVAGESAHRPGRWGGVAGLAAGPAASTTLLYLHGGGYCLGSAGVAAPITARLAVGRRVLSLDYRLAPEHPFPAALDDALTAYRALLDEGVTPPAVGGDSAGGALAVGLAFECVERGWPAPGALLLLCPHLDHSSSDSAPLTAAYRGDAPEEHPLLSPLRADTAQLTALPPTLLQTGTADPLHRQALRFARRVRAAGGTIELDVWDGLWHTWQYHRDLPEADRALAEASTWLAAHAR